MFEKTSLEKQIVLYTLEQRWDISGALCCVVTNALSLAVEKTSLLQCYYHLNPLSSTTLQRALHMKWILDKVIFFTQSELQGVSWWVNLFASARVSCSTNLQFVSGPFHKRLYFHMAKQIIKLLNLKCIQVLAFFSTRLQNKSCLCACTPSGCCTLLSRERPFSFH